MRFGDVVLDHPEGQPYTPADTYGSSWYS